MRHHPSYRAFLAHRLSGIALALFLPVHLLVLGLAVETAALDGFLDWAAQPMVKAAEAILVVLLALHMFGGLRLLAIELLPWSDRQKDWIGWAAAAALAVGAGFVLRSLA
ncbi:MAG: succinate dehydrogenase [Alphaproteobacteria bacterium]|nr:succinate dehydrogenase [Alphaproteobacteria bacterium]